MLNNFSDWLISESQKYHIFLQLDEKYYNGAIDSVLDSEKAAEKFKIFNFYDIKTLRLLNIDFF